MHDACIMKRRYVYTAHFDHMWANTNLNAAGTKIKIGLSIYK